MGKSRSGVCSWLPPFPPRLHTACGRNGEPKKKSGRKSRGKRRGRSNPGGLQRGGGAVVSPGRAGAGGARHYRGVAAGAVAAGARGRRREQQQQQQRAEVTGLGERGRRRAGRGRAAPAVPSPLPGKCPTPAAAPGLRVGNSRCPPLPRRRGFSGKCPFATRSPHHHHTHTRHRCRLPPTAAVAWRGRARLGLP